MAGRIRAEAVFPAEEAGAEMEPPRRRADQTAAENRNVGSVADQREHEARGRGKRGRNVHAKNKRVLCEPVFHKAGAAGQRPAVSKAKTGVRADDNAVCRLRSGKAGVAAELLPCGRVDVGRLQPRAAAPLRFGVNGKLLIMRFPQRLVHLADSNQRPCIRVPEQGNAAAGHVPCAGMGNVAAADGQPPFAAGGTPGVQLGVMGQRRRMVRRHGNARKGGQRAVQRGSERLGVAERMMYARRFPVLAIVRPTGKQR